MTSNQDRPYRIMLAIQLGWLTIEAFSRLRRWARTGRIPSDSKGDALRRFNFSDRDPSQYQQLIIALKQLRTTSSHLLPELSKPILEHPDELIQHSKEDVNAVWLNFEDRSREIWSILQIEDPLAGRAFTYGGSLADTFWHAEGAGPDQLPDLLRKQRLEHIAARYDSIAEHLSAYTADVIHHTIYRWRIADRLKGMDDEAKKVVLARLEAQTKVWHDLLFGLQSAENYLREGDRRRITWGAFSATVLLVVLVGVAVWLAVLLLSRTGWSVMASTTGITRDLSETNSALTAELLNWQNWSTLLASLSSVVVVLTGFITRISGWMIAFHNKARNWLTLSYIRRRTYRDWRSKS